MVSFAKEGNIPAFQVAHYPKFDHFVNILAAQWDLVWCLEINMT